MPRPVNSCGDITWLRRLISTMSIPPSTCTQTLGPSAVRCPSAPRPGCENSSSTAITVTATSSGAPEAGPHFPPSRRSMRAPTPASRHSCTAPRSQNAPIATSPMPCSSSARRRKVLSLIAPPPALSPMSASTIGPPSAASAWACASAAAILRPGVRVCSRRSQNARPSSSATRAASAGSSSVTTQSLAPASGTSAQGKPWPSDTESTPGCRSAASMRRTKPAIGSRVVCHRPTMRQSNTAVVGLTRPCAASSTIRSSSRMRGTASTCGYSL